MKGIKNLTTLLDLMGKRETLVKYLIPFDEFHGEIFLNQGWN